MVKKTLPSNVDIVNEHHLFTPDFSHVFVGGFPSLHIKMYFKKTRMSINLDFLKIEYADSTLSKMKLT